MLLVGEVERANQRVYGAFGCFAKLQKEYRITARPFQTPRKAHTDSLSTYKPYRSPQTVTWASSATSSLGCSPGGRSHKHPKTAYKKRTTAPGGTPLAIGTVSIMTTTNPGRGGKVGALTRHLFLHSFRISERVSEHSTSTPKTREKCTRGHPTGYRHNFKHADHESGAGQQGMGAGLAPIPAQLSGSGIPKSTQKAR